jgi:hypothetical protein
LAANHAKYANEEDKLPLFGGWIAVKTLLRRLFMGLTGRSALPFCANVDLNL